jgi:hypothetical protein
LQTPFVVRRVARAAGSGLESFCPTRAFPQRLPRHKSAPRNSRAVRAPQNRPQPGNWRNAIIPLPCHRRAILPNFRSAERNCGPGNRRGGLRRCDRPSGRLLCPLGARPWRNVRVPLTGRARFPRSV